MGKKNSSTKNPALGGRAGDAFSKANVDGDRSTMIGNCELTGPGPVKPRKKVDTTKDSSKGAPVKIGNAGNGVLPPNSQHSLAETAASSGTKTAQHKEMVLSSKNLPFLRL
ncbi:Hypothetical predicted protein [Olea europaea subsp. europaea]|uniref:Uncharacterized protein n=1 Tax=Olea europaea subsp. europaea TaxID=158383 RepID=A0A8S0V5T9_OLEEU|nr:Hypothetical predicted protein [Olea europaea subsp. europaea]